MATTKRQAIRIVGQKDVKLFLFGIIYKENPTEPTKKLLELQVSWAMLQKTRSSYKDLLYYNIPGTNWIKNLKTIYNQIENVKCLAKIWQKIWNTCTLKTIKYYSEKFLKT